MSGDEDGAVYVYCHTVAIAWQAVALAALIWLAHDLRSAWPLAAMALVRGYKHDFHPKGGAAK